MNRFILTTTLIGIATTVVAHPGHTVASNGNETWTIAGLVVLALAGVPFLRRALRK
ncbi:MAG: hypothetical protein AAF557_23750 [Pseudomonadota bacterium]